MKHTPLHILTLAVILSVFTSCHKAAPGTDLVLNGKWQYGYGRNYVSEGIVPGIHVETSRSGEDTLWYRRTVDLPGGDWENAVLELKGARFRPQVYVNGKFVCAAEGGMVRTLLDVTDAALAPGMSATIEIALAPLKDVPVEDASYVPVADQWRSNCASCLWDDVVLHLYKGARTDRIVTRADCGTGTLSLTYRILGQGAKEAVLRISRNGFTITTLRGPAVEGESELLLDYRGILEEWTPDNPVCYDMTLSLLAADGSLCDEYRQTLGVKDLRITDKQFNLNAKPFKLRGGSIVWHRWMRDPQGRRYGWDAAWIERNIVRRLKDHGANALRFHLGVPPERILDICDRTGLAVQYEWSFFHGMPASGRSLVEQYSRWLDMASRHPSVCFYHPYNETQGTQLDTVWTALNSILPQYQDILIEDRDIIHVHKYWWSLFENLGLYYDSADQFGKAVMVDEFGGNYLDSKGDMGLYPSIKESMMRFLGPDHDAVARYRHQNRSCAKVAEYWRRIGAAGVAPFVIASSQEDGCTWFDGDLSEGRPKPVWDALTVLWSPQAASMDIWDCDFTPSQTVRVPIHFINDMSQDARLRARTSVCEPDGRVLYSVLSEAGVPAYGREVRDVELQMPDREGNYLLRTELLWRPSRVKYPVRSDWDIRVLRARVPEGLDSLALFIPEAETELRAFAGRFGFSLAALEEADLALCGRASWPLSDSLSDALGEATRRGCSVILLDVGDNGLGIGYPQDGHSLGNLQGITRLDEARCSSFKLFRSLSMESAELPEAESHIHPVKGGSMALWKNSNSSITQLWNGLRGGLMVPAFDMILQGLDSDAFLRRWLSCGADESSVKGQAPYFAYNLCGYYAFSSSADDKAVKDSLRRRVQFLIDDAPALATALNAKAPIRVTDLSEGYRRSLSGEASSFEPLACAGKNLTRIPVVKIGFGAGEGCVILSQLLTGGRLAPGEVQGSFPAKYDEAAVQLVLNMMGDAVLSVK